MDKLT